MKQGRNLPILIKLVMAIGGVGLLLINFWPVTIIFFVVGGIATGIIILAGYEVNFFWVVFIEFVLMVVFLFLGMHIVERKHSTIL